MENGLPALVIDGEVANVSSVRAPGAEARRRPARPAASTSLQDLDLRGAGRRACSPGESVPFHTSITQPAEAARAWS